MLTLRELQTRFVDAIADGALDPMQDEIVTAGVNVADRLDIYRNNLHEGFIKALAIGFPVIERLTGTDYFRQLARALQRAHPSRSGNLDHIGEPFPDFMRERFAGTEYEYLADVAALEWAHQRALIAADAEPLAVEALQAVDPEQLDQLRFDLHPACTVMRSSYPIVRIWRANQPDATDEAVIDLRSGGDDIVVLRSPECVEFHRFPAADCALLAVLARGETLGAALEAAQSVAPTFDLAVTLRRVLPLPILAGLRVPARPTQRIQP